MNAPVEPVTISTTPTPGTATELGIFLGRLLLADQLYALFQPSKAIAERPPAVWTPGRERLDDALSLGDGYANTVAMAKAGSETAQYALDNGLHIPAIDEADLQFRILKPGTQRNSCWMRSGINMSAEIHLPSYTEDSPAQTALENFRACGPESFIADECYWTSTQSRDWDVTAWVQWFADGGQYGNGLKATELPVRLVRRLIIR